MTHIGHNEKVFIMKRLLLILILTFSFQTLSKADDISDFQIEGMSIGDSALDHFSKKEIDDQASNGNYKSKKFKYVTLESDNFNTYEDIQIHYLSNDSKYIIHSISANINFPNNFPNNFINNFRNNFIIIFLLKVVADTRYYLIFINYLCYVIYFFTRTFSSVQLPV